MSWQNKQRVMCLRRDFEVEEFSEIEAFVEREMDWEEAPVITITLSYQRII